MTQPYPHQSTGDGHDPSPAAPTRRRRWPWVVGGLAVLVVIGSAVGGRSGTSTSTAPSATAAAPSAAPTSTPTPAPPPPAAVAPAPPPAAPSGDAIRYEVSGNGVREAGNITYVADENFSQRQANGESLPWAAEVTMGGGSFGFQPLSLVAQSSSGGDGEITCRILRNGGVVVENTSSGAYAVVTCSAG